MKRVLSVMTGALLLIALLATTAVAASPTSGTSSCATIGDGTIVDSMGNPVSIGFDEFGYNYQAHLFVGTYDGADRTLDGLFWGGQPELADDRLIMKWSDAWLANVDCDFDGKLDRGLIDGTVGGISLGWLTNQVRGDYTDGFGEVHRYTSFDKIVWTGPGSSLWGQYTVIHSVYNDPAAGTTGVVDKPVNPGFGLNDFWTTN